MTTKECLRKILENKNEWIGGYFVVLYGHTQGLYDNVNWQLIARFLKTERIDSYTMTNKITIEWKNKFAFHFKKN